jgi:hypothetical protein
MAAHGDLSGNFNTPTVTGLDGIPIVGTPSLNQVLKYNGSQYVPATISGGGGGGSGTVTTASVVSANGLAGTVANPTTTPAITLSTSVTGILKGNGTAISAATAGTDYSSPMSVIAVQTADYAANSGEIIPMNASAAARTVTLPTAPTNNTTIAVRKTDTSGNAVTITPGGTDTVNGGTTTLINIPNMIVTYRYDTSTTDWVVTSSAFPTYSTTADTTLALKSTSATKAATINLDSGSSTNGNVQGRIGGTLAWIAGRAGHSGFNIYTNGATQALNIDDSQVATFKGDVTMTGGKNIVLSATTGTKLGTATTHKLAFWNSTPVAQQSGNALTALSTIGLVASPTLAESDITNLTTDLAAKAALASPTFTGTPAAPTAANGTNTTQVATTAFVLANAGASPLTTKGDLFTYSTTNTRLPAGTDGYALVADSAQTTGLRWASVSGTGDMAAATYDPAAIAQQVVGTSATQTVSNKTLTAVGGITMSDAVNFVVGTTTGTQIGTSTSQKLGFFAATPVVQQSATADLGTALSNLGLRASGTAYTMTTTGFISLGGAVAVIPTTRSANATLTSTSVMNNLINATSGNITITLPATTVRSGLTFTIKKTDSSVNTVTVTRAGTDTIDGATTYVLSTQYQFVTIVSDSAGTWWITAKG